MIYHLRAIPEQSQLNQISEALSVWFPQLRSQVGDHLVRQIRHAGLTLGTVSDQLVVTPADNWLRVK